MPKDQQSGSKRTEEISPLSNQNQSFSQTTPANESFQSQSMLADPAAWLTSSHLLQLQKIVGNRTVLQLMRARTAQPDKQIERGLSTSKIVQKSSKDSIEQPDESEASDQVPDLPKDLVMKISKSKKRGDRQAVLEEILAYLDGKAAIDEINRTEIKYVDSDKPERAVTVIAGTKDDDPVRITFYRGAFESPSILYSVFRHELIHVGQRLLVPDEEGADMKDKLMHENIYDEGVGALTTKSLQLPLQEIEAHVWEIDHAEETGITGEYNAETVVYLIDYVDKLIKAIQDETLVPDDAYEYWKGYIYNAKIQLDNCIVRNLDLADKKEDLFDAIEEREQMILNNKMLEDDEDD
jgi:hypothetical protein